MIYEIKKKVREISFGEITFYHGGCCQEITPAKWDKKMGSWIDLNSDKIKLKSRTT